jgi:hypothetical protein
MFEGEATELKTLKRQVHPRRFSAGGRQPVQLGLARSQSGYFMITEYIGPSYEVSPPSTEYSGSRSYPVIS